MLFRSRGKKSFNIRNVDAHLNNFRKNDEMLNADFVNDNNVVLNKQQREREIINSKFGVSKYASNLVSGKMFKKI